MTEYHAQGPLTLARKIENVFSFLYATKPGDSCHFDRDLIDQIKAAALKGAAASETKGQEAEQARRFRLIQSAYANEYRLRDSIKAEMKEAGARGELMMNGQCKDWPAYVQAIARREEIVEEVVNAANR